MPHLEIIFTLTLLGASFPLCGYALGVASLKGTVGERLALGVLMGLGLLVWSISVVNLFLPLTGLNSLLCLWPVPVSLMRKESRARLSADLGELLKHKRTLMGAGLAILLPLLLLGPILVNPELMFFDGTSNHDSFFWITNAEYLRQHNYLTTPEANLLHPAYNSVGSMTGMYPLWGRMGGEGLVAFAASLVDTPSERVYLAMSAALLLPWLAASYLILRRFFVEGLSKTAVVALVLLQPIFLFAHLNANLPNLLGAIFGAAAVLATEWAMDGKENRRTWLMVLTVSAHGLFCSYPEMVPFVVAPAGLLWLRRTPEWLRKPSLIPLWPILGWCGGALINVATTQRAWVGFISSFYTGRANQNWGNIFSRLSGSELLPGMITLSPSAAELLGWTLGTLVSAALVAGLVMAALKARDRRGALLLCFGGAILMAYTLYTGFLYGWQKSVQFTGVFAAVWTIAALRALVPEPQIRGTRRVLSLAALGLLGGYLCFATGNAIGKAWWWSDEKDITKEWSELQAQVRRNKIKGAILIDSATFGRAFFHGMWSPYFLPETPIVYAERDPNAGGYLRYHSLREKTAGAPKTEAILVGGDWAQTWDLNSPRLVETKAYALLQKNNRVSLMDGFFPLFGVAARMSGAGHVEFTPHSDSTLTLEISAAHALTRAQVNQLFTGTLKTAGRPEQIIRVPGAGPWKLNFALEGGLAYKLSLDFSTPPPEAAGLFPYEVKTIQIENVTIRKPSAKSE